MRIHELESLLGIAKENIRYYEKEGLLAPARKENGYREYSQEDAERLKKIIVLRKIGIPVKDIRDILSGSTGLQEALETNVRKLEDEIASMQDVQRICHNMQKENVSIENLDADAYLNDISTAAAEGGKFMDLSRDVLQYSSELFVDAFGHWQFFFPIYKPLFLKRKRKGSVALAVATLIVLILVGGSVSATINPRNNAADGPYFRIGMLTYAGIVLVWFILRNIVYFLSRRFEKAEKPITIIGSILCALASVGLAFAAVMHWSRILMFRPYTGTAHFLDESADSLDIFRDDRMPSVNNGFQSYDQYTYYTVYDQEYIQAVKEAILDAEATGKWSVIHNDFDLFKAKELVREAGGDMGPFYQILWYSEENMRYTFFYLYEDEKEGWILDEPAYGIFKAGDELVSLAKEYDEHIEIRKGYVEQFNRLFTYDPAEVWHEPYDPEGKYDHYRIINLIDRETGEDVTEEFLEKYRSAWENKDWETLIKAYKTVQETGRTELVNPPAE